MRRREFISGVLGSAAAWPRPALAQQQPGRVRLIGALTGIADDSESKIRYAAFRQELQRLGWIDGQNVRIDTRFGEGDAARSRKQVAELIRGEDASYRNALDGSRRCGGAQIHTRTGRVEGRSSDCQRHSVTRRRAPGDFDHPHSFCFCR
jgi:hypothetical protein